MPGPWEKYQSAASGKPWEKYSGSAAVADTSRPAGLPAGVDLPSAPASRLPIGMTSNKPGDSADWRMRLLGKDGGEDLIKAIPRHVRDSALGLASAALHPITTVKSALVDPIAQGIPKIANDYRALTADAPGSTSGKHLDVSAGHAKLANDVVDSIPFIGPWARNVENEAKERGALPALIGLGADFAAPELSAEAVGAVSKGGNVLRRPFVGAVDETIPGTSTTPRARYEAARRLGVNLDLADATNSTAANVVKHIGRDSLAGSGVYERAKATNLGRLGEATDRTLQEMSPLDREAGGVRLQDILKEDQQRLKSKSDELYGKVQGEYGDTPVADPGKIRNTARGILDETAAARKEFPSLTPRVAQSVLEDSSNFGYHGFTPKVSTALSGRSGMLDLYRANPDLVKTAADAQLQRMVEATHGSIMESLPESAQGDLRTAQETYKEMKNVYDNPSSPYYDAIRTPNPSGKVAGIGPKTPEGIRDVVQRVGDEGRGILQRGQTEKLLGTAPGTEEFNFRSFPTQFSRLPADYAKELFGERLAPLRDISDTSQALSRDLNPSGTAKQGQKLAEAAALIPTGGLPLLQYPLARLMNSPKLVDFIIREQGSSSLGRISDVDKVIPFITAPKKNGTR